MTNEPIDWKATEEKAAGMSDAALWGAILDIQKTLPAADALDREDGGTRGGWYRDEASVYHRERFRRMKAPAKSPALTADERRRAAGHDHGRR